MVTIHMENSNMMMPCHAVLMLALLSSTQFPPPHQSGPRKAAFAKTRAVS